MKEGELASIWIRSLVSAGAGKMGKKGGERDFGNITHGIIARGGVHIISEQQQLERGDGDGNVNGKF